MTDWSRDLVANPDAELRQGRNSQRIRAVPVPDVEKPPLIVAYLKAWGRRPGVQQQFEKTPDPKGVARHQRHLEVRFDGPPADLSTIPGVTNVFVDRDTVTCRFAGDVRPLLQHLAALPVCDLTIERARLEDIQQSLDTVRLTDGEWVTVEGSARVVEVQH